MIAFVVSSLIFTLFFLAVLTAEPIGVNYLSHLQWRWIARIRGWRHTGLCLLLFALVVPFLLLCIIAGQVHPRYSAIESVFDFVFSPAFMSTVVGAIFSGILVIWLHQIYRLKDQDKITPFIYVEVILLIVLVLIGCSDVFGPVLKRVSGFKLPGAELSFYQQERAAPAADPNAVGLTAADVTRNDVTGNVGLAGLSELAEFISRDDQYLLANGAVGDGQSHSGRWKLLIQNTFSALARCQDAVYAETQELQSVQEQAGRLMPALRSYRRALDFDGALRSDSSHRAVIAVSAHRLADVFADAAVAALDRGLQTEFIPSASLVLDQIEPQRAHHGTEAAKACVVLLQAPCSLPDTKGDATAFKAQQPPYCQRLEPLKIQSDPNLPNPRPPQTAPPAVQDIIDAYRDYIRGSLPTMLIDALEHDPEHYERPYLSLLYAYTAALAREPEAAGVELNGWLAGHPVLRPEMPMPKGYDWYRARVLTTLVNITEEAVRREGRLTRVMQQYLLQSYLRAIEAESLPFVSAGLVAFRWKANQAPATSLQLDHYDSGDCITPEKLDDQIFQRQVTAAFAKISMTTNFVDRALDDPDYLTAYSPQVHQFLASMDGVDFSCLSRIGVQDWRDQAKLYHAEILRLDAKRIIVDSALLARSENPATLERSLRTGLQAADAAMRLLNQPRNAAIAARAKATAYIDQTSASDAEDIYSRTQVEVLALQRRLAGP